MGEAMWASIAMRSPTPIPAIPPDAVSVIASTRNCVTMSDRSAPRALRTPISRVLSLTETSMTFMTPTPPTRSPIEEMKNIDT
jgi:hypothetical protein